MELYTGLRRLTIKNTGLRSIQPRAFDKNPHLRYMNTAAIHGEDSLPPVQHSSGRMRARNLTGDLNV
ncbi:UNVERIFIED_CONTAM: hypothetical protein K2H54_032612 [Gekko kuhli]